MEVMPGEYPSYECFHSPHSDCEGFRLDTRGTIELSGGNVPEHMKTVPDGKIISESLCSCTCHDRKVLREKDEQVFSFAYNATVQMWGTSIREGSLRESEDREYANWVEQSGGNLP